MILAAGEAARLRDLVAADPRTRSCTIATREPERIIREGRVALIPGDCAVSAATLSRLRERGDNGRPRCSAARAAGEGSRHLPWRRCSSTSPSGPAPVPIGAGESPPADDADPAPLGDALCVRVTDDPSARAAEERLLAELRGIDPPRATVRLHAGTAFALAVAQPASGLPHARSARTTSPSWAPASACWPRGA